jgi:hypothetical protein
LNHQLEQKQLKQQQLLHRLLQQSQSLKKLKQQQQPQPHQHQSKLQLPHQKQLPQKQLKQQLGGGDSCSAAVSQNPKKCPPDHGDSADELTSVLQRNVLGGFTNAIFRPCIFS